ncbi:replication protein, partial [Enterococcus faecium]
MNSGKFFPPISFFFEEELYLSKKGTIINEWENLRALSIRRLNVKTFYTPLK